jgi:hypothetical protein
VLQNIPAADYAKEQAAERAREKAGRQAIADADAYTRATVRAAELEKLHKPEVSDTSGETRLGVIELRLNLLDGFSHGEIMELNDRLAAIEQRAARRWWRAVWKWLPR